MPDELTQRIDATAARTGRPWQLILGELLAHYTIQEQDRQRKEMRAELQRYLGQKQDT